MKLSDFKGVLNKSFARVEAVENPYGDYYVIKLKPEGKLQWEAGEHGIFTLPDRTVEGKKWRAFSVASVAGEGYILLGTRLGKEVSSYKKNLINMKKGERIGVRGLFGWFKLQDKTTPLVLVASGVGITPVRALLKKLESDMSREVHLIYASSDYHLFGEELEGIASKNSAMTIYKTGTAEETQQETKKLASKFGNGALYYISGSMPVIKSIKELLKGQEVKGKRIISDPFLGY